ncbi:unnamed protein product [Chrysoparadoxa australica]
MDDGIRVSGGTVEEETAECCHCGHQVPIANKVVHELRCTRVHHGQQQQQQQQMGLRRRRAPQSSTTQDTTHWEETKASEPPAAEAPSLAQPQLNEQPPYQAQAQARAQAEGEWPCAICTFSNQASSSACSMCNAQRGATDAGVAAAAAAAAGAAQGASATQTGGTGESENPQSCPRCTYVNSEGSDTCEMCGERLQRGPDSSFRDRLIPPVASGDGAGEGMGAFGGAINGAMLGAVAAGMLGGGRNRSVLGDMLQGALVGGGAGAILGSAMQPSDGGGGPSTRTRSRSSIRTSHGFGTGLGGQSVIISSDERLLEQLRAMLGGGQAGSGDDYEQLLRQFGGPEARPASEAAVRSIPSSRVSPAEADRLAQADETCCICMEAFAEGDSVKRLQCTHMFHEKCVDTWLRSNGSCPVCKMEVP